MEKIRKIGVLTDKVITQLDLENTKFQDLKKLQKNSAILCSDSTIEHIKNEHPEDYEKYKDEMSIILEQPDYIGIHPKRGSIEYFKEYVLEGTKERVIVAIRATKKQTLFVRSMYVVSNENFENFLQKNTIQPYKKDHSALL